MEMLNVFMKPLEWKHVAGITIGGYVGLGLGLSAAGAQLATMMTAPISYPVCGFIGGAISTPQDPIGGAMKQGVMGSLSVPLVPVHLMIVPATVVVSTWGGIIGGAILSDYLFKETNS